MPKEIEQIWVILANGTCAVHRCYGQHKHISRRDSQVIAGFMSAIHSMTRSMDTEIESIKMRNRELHFLYLQSHMIVIVCQRNKSAKARKTLNKINELLTKSFDMREMMFVKRDIGLLLFSVRLDELLGHDQCREVREFMYRMARDIQELQVAADTIEMESKIKEVWALVNE